MPCPVKQQCDYNGWEGKKRIPVLSETVVLVMLILPDSGPLSTKQAGRVSSLLFLFLNDIVPLNEFHGINHMTTDFKVHV